MCNYPLIHHFPGGGEPRHRSLSSWLRTRMKPSCASQHTRAPGLLCALLLGAPACPIRVVTATSVTALLVGNVTFSLQCTRRDFRCRLRLQCLPEPRCGDAAIPVTACLGLASRSHDPSAGKDVTSVSHAVKTEVQTGLV